MIFFLVLLILLSAWLSGAETALFSLSPLTIKSYGHASDTRLKLISRLMENPRQILVSILILNILANILIQNTVSILFGPYEGWALKVGVPLVVTLIFGEVLPKSIALPNHTTIAYRVAPWVHRVSQCLRVMQEPLTKMTSAIARILFFFLRKEREISADELRHVLKTSEERGILLPVESELIGGTLDLQHSHVKEHMRPREEVLFYDIQEPISLLMELFVDKAITRIPVCDGHLENLLGILSARQFFFHKTQISGKKDLLPILRKPFYLPESTRAWTALRNLRERGIHLAMVVDEYGSISGLITQEDLVEAVIGEIIDARDVANLYTRSSDDVIIASGKMELSEFRDLFGVDLKTDGNIVTLGGWLIEQLGDIPATGTKYATDDFLFYVLSAEPNRVRRIYVRRLKK
ncbi:MAG: hemolysin family protein [Verrucomicrobia bacterium]|nr:hemolysin family protein [Verrucomicrobiota bacterium]MDE3047242.1 HlyC/CorC family transporter [Verrucomicrobiota bacterium]